MLWRNNVNHHIKQLFMKNCWVFGDLFSNNTATVMQKIFVITEKKLFGFYQLFEFQLKNWNELFCSSMLTNFCVPKFAIFYADSARFGRNFQIKHFLAGSCQIIIFLRFWKMIVHLPESERSLEDNPLVSIRGSKMTHVSNLQIIQKRILFWLLWHLWKTRKMSIKSVLYTEEI